MKLTKAYSQWLQQLKTRVRSAQIKAAVKVNTELLALYWELGTEILEKEKNAGWGTGFLQRLSQDLQKTFPHLKGFSLTNIKYIRLWVNFYQSSIRQQAVDELKRHSKNTKPAGIKSQQVVDQIPLPLSIIPWGHHLQIITKCNDTKEALFYITQTTQHNWSRSVLVHQIESNLYKRKGKALTNFAYTLPKPQSDLANELLKNPYHFDFLQLADKVTEKDLETALIDQLVKFLLELGAGFAYVNRQQLIVVDGEDFFIDLLFYHTKLHCYVVIELKMDNFKPEYAGKLNFYLSAVDAQMKAPQDQPSVGLLLCKKAGKLIVEYALKNITTPIGVSEYKLTDSIPTKLKGKLPSIQQIEKGLKRLRK